MECEGVKDMLAGLKEGVSYQCVRAVLRDRELFYVNKGSDPDWLGRIQLLLDAIKAKNCREVRFFKPEIEATASWIMEEARKFNLRH